MGIIDKVMKLLEENNMNQKQLYEYLNVKAQTFSDWKAGRNKSYMKYITQIADYFNVSVDYLTGKTEKKNPPAKTEGIEDDEDVKAFANLLNDLTDEELAQVAEFVALLKQKRNS